MNLICLLTVNKSGNHLNHFYEVIKILMSINGNYVTVGVAGGAVPAGVTGAGEVLHQVAVHTPVHRETGSHAVSKHPDISLFLDLGNSLFSRFFSSFEMAPRVFISCWALISLRLCEKRIKFSLWKM